MSEFRNAYHFVPRRPPSNTDKRALPEKQSDYGLGPKRIADGHAAYAPGTHSGRITCRITLECETVIGAKRHSGEGQNRYSQVEPFLFGGRPAIPASSLKGVLSSIAESVSRAPYRVLSDEMLTVAWSERDAAKNWQRFRHYPGNPGFPLTHVHDHVPADSRPLTIHSDKAKSLRPTRSEINPVEAMFGFIRDMANKGPKAAHPTDKVAKATPVSAAGKLRFSHAVPSGDFAQARLSSFFLDVEEKLRIPAVANYAPKGLHLIGLKEQAQPMKRPKRTKKEHGPDPKIYADLRSATPNFYFVREGQPDSFIDRKAFASSPGDYAIQGTKFYLHHPDTAAEPWKTADDRKSHKDLERKAAVPLLKTGVTFDFHVDFDNLSDHELNILCYSLRPSEQFRHKIGLGKALGLGSIRIDPLSLVLVDRVARYAAKAVFAEDDRKAAADGTGRELFDRHFAAHSGWLENEDKPAKRALLAIGETHQFGDGPHRAGSDVPVLPVPLTEEKFDARGKTVQAVGAETDSFAWFVRNDTGTKETGWKAWRQRLRPISEDDFVPVLTTDGTAPKTWRPARAASAMREISGVVAQPDEMRGKLKFWQPHPKTGNAPFAMIVPDGGGADRYVDADQCRAIGLDKASKGRAVLFTPGKGNRVNSIKLF